eukprot:PhM_4_TR412/c0_g1_i1/m.23521
MDAELSKLLAEQQEVRSKIDRLRQEEAKKKWKDAEKRELTEKEVMAIRASFDRFDTDRSGSIDRAELAECAKSLGVTLTQDGLNEALRALDTDKDGSVSFDEFRTWWSSDASLGGHSGVQLAIMRAKLLAATLVKDIDAFDPISVDEPTKEMHEFSVDMATSEQKPAKIKFVVSAVPVKNATFRETISQWASDSVPTKDEDGEFHIFQGVCVTFKLVDGCDMAVLRGKVDALTTALDEIMPQEAIPRRVCIEGGELKVYVFQPNNHHTRKIVDSIRKMTGAGPEAMLDSLALTVESGVSPVDHFTTLDENSFDYGFLDTYKVKGSAKVRKDFVDGVVFNMVRDSRALRMLSRGPSRAPHLYLSILGGLVTVKSDVKLTKKTLTQAINETTDAATRLVLEKFRAAEKGIDELIATGEVSELESLKEGIELMRDEARLRTFLHDVILTRNGMCPTRMETGNLYSCALHNIAWQASEEDLLEEVALPAAAILSSVAELTCVQQMSELCAMRIDVSGVDITRLHVSEAKMREFAATKPEQPPPRSRRDVNVRNNSHSFDVAMTCVRNVLD